jgi:4a-hydroxytetrahydrobiopterin dehydratase
MPERLSDDALDAALVKLSWTREGDELVKQVTRSDFVDAVRFVDAVVPVAEEANHHPDVAISWNKVTLRLSTHSAGGLTQLDLDLAAKLDQLK